MTILKVDSIAELNLAWHKINWPCRRSVAAFCATVVKVDPPSTIVTIVTNQHISVKWMVLM